MPVATAPMPLGGYPVKSNLTYPATAATAVNAALVPRTEPITVYATDGAIDPTVGIAKLTKGSAGAYTLAAPSAAQEGRELRITNGTAFAHVVTATGLLDDGVTGGAKNAATFGAFVGSTISLLAVNGHWNVESLKVVTVA